MSEFWKHRKILVTGGAPLKEWNILSNQTEPPLFDASKPDGSPQKLLDVSRMAALGWHAQISLREGIALAYQDFLK